MAKDVKITGDSSSLINSIKASIQAVNAQSASIKKLIDESIAYNKIETQQIINAKKMEAAEVQVATARERHILTIKKQLILETQLATAQTKGLTAKAQLNMAEEKHRRVLDTSNISEQKAIKLARERAKTIDEVNRALQMLQQIEKQAKTSRQVDTLVSRGVSATPAYKTATTSEKLSYKEAIASLRVFVKSHSIGIAKIKRMWTDVTHGNVKAYTGALGEAQRKLYALKTTKDKLGHSARELAKQTSNFAKKSHSVLLTWKGLARLFGVQLAHRAIAQLTRVLADGVREAIELEKRIAEVRTISQEKQLPFQAWIRGLRELSDAWGLDLVDQAEAAYQTLSNQVAKGAEVFKFMSDANRFAVSSVSSTADATLLLTAALNAFRIDVSKTEQVAAGFFKTIELGRVRASEMATSFGDVGVLAHQLGVELPELQSVIATLTIQGIAYNKAGTQMRGIFIKLIKPTKEMKKLYNELGVETGEAAIKAYGLGGLLSILQERTKGSSSEFAKYINRIRGISGALALTGEGFEKYKSNLEKIENAQESYANATKIVMENAGKQLEIQINKIKNYFKKDLGDELLRYLAQASGGFENLAGSVIKLTRVALTVGPVLVAAGVAAAIVLNYTVAIPIAIMGISAALFALKKTNSDIIRESKTEHLKWSKTFAESLLKNKKDHTQYVKAINKNLKDMRRGMALTTAAAYKEYAKQTNDLEKSLKVYTKVINSAFSKVKSRISQHINNLKSEYGKLEKIVENTSDRIYAIITATEKFQFSVTMVDMSEIEKIMLIERRVKKLTEELHQAARKGDAKAVSSIGKELEELAKKQSSLVSKIKKENVTTLNDLEATFDAITDKYVKLERKRLRLERARRSEEKRGHKESVKDIDVGILDIDIDLDKLNNKLRAAILSSFKGMSLGELSDIEEEVTKQIGVIGRSIDRLPEYSRYKKKQRRNLEGKQEILKIVQEEQLKLTRPEDPRESALELVEEVKVARMKAEEDLAEKSRKLMLANEKERAVVRTKQFIFEEAYKVFKSYDVTKIAELKTQKEVTEEYDKQKKAVEKLLELGREISLIDVFGADVKVDFGNLEEQLRKRSEALENIRIRDELKRKISAKQTENDINDTAIALAKDTAVKELAIKTQLYEDTVGLVDLYLKETAPTKTKEREGGPAAYDTKLYDRFYQVDDKKAMWDFSPLWEGQPPEFNKIGDVIENQANLYADAQKVFGKALTTFLEEAAMGNVTLETQQAALIAIRDVIQLLRTDIDTTEFIEHKELLLEIHKNLTAQSVTQKSKFAESNEALSETNELIVSIEEGTAGLNKNFGFVSQAVGKLAKEVAKEPLKKTAERIAEIAVNLGKIAKWAEELKLLAPKPDAGGKYRGAYMHFAQGGITPVGRDSIPALLSPGEAVINAAATRRFYGKLVGMNSATQGFNRGGTGSQTTVGNININMESSGDASGDVVKFGKKLRREIHRGRVKLT